MKQYVRTFSIGLFIASLLLLITFLFSNSSLNNRANLSDDEMVEHLKDSGYRVVTESEYISLSVQQDKNKEKSTSNKEKDADKEDKKDSDDKKASDKNEEKDKKDKKDKEKPKSYTIEIASGMAISEVTNQLENDGLIKDARKYDQYLKKHDYEKYIQLGKHKVTDDMSEQEIAEELIKK
ncbi:MAG TPA: hypothetical protein VK111_01080 [Virgibacillus sp.]|nr:hypothetical protein [Virgibacillus sp.]